MRRLLYAVLVGLIATNIWADTIYTWIDENGRRVYSNTPAKGAQAVDLPPYTEVSPPSQWRSSPKETPPPSTSNKRTSPPAKPPPAWPVQYQSFEIIEPQANAHIYHAAGNVTVALQSQPQLAQGHKVQLKLDGRVHQSPMHTLYFVLHHLPPGKHELQIEVLDDYRGVFYTSPVRTFYLHRVTRAQQERRKASPNP